MFNRKVAGFILFLVLAVVLVACGGDDLSGEELRVAVENAYTPFNFYDPDTGEPVGYDYDLFNEVLQAKPENRIETVQEWAKARERNMQLPGNIIMTIIPFLFVSWYSIPLALTVATGGRLVTPHLKDKPIMRRLGTLYCDSPIEKFLSPIFSSNSFSQLFKGLNKIWHFNNNL